MSHGAEVGVDWVNGLVIHEGDTDWHPWDETLYGPCPLISEADR